MSKIDANGAPSIPRDISPDGREVWDWAARLSAYTHRQDELRRLTKEISQIGTKCGDCYNWMKSSLCPRETRNNAGRRVGPSMNEFVCSNFQEDARQTKRREELKSKADAIRDAMIEARKVKP